MRLLLIALVCVSSALGAFVPSRILDEDWEAWKNLHGKAYGSVTEEAERRMVWEENLSIIKKHNLEHDMGLTTFRLGMNKFGDLTNAEFVASWTGLKQGTPKSNMRASTFLPPNFSALPKKVDWRTKGYVTPVKNQEQCGSCWAFSAVGSLEGQHFKQTGKLVSLSEQNLVDCSGPEGNDGCEGGWPVWAYEYIKSNNGIDTESGYPYVGVDEDCHFTTSDVGATITGFTEVKAMDEHALEKAIANVGPISVCIDAAHSSFQLYTSGVYSEPDCSSQALDHCVTAVGYDETADGQKYYIVKNSWGTDWGQEGYIWMSRENDNNCGIATNASYPLV
ncbi:cathepsin L-like peptidase [Diadema setosum]|uniref:cathepsin L-like peptidase n=1 Tax=Diadema setosum TaxID=31175 RepID=UPI003B3B61A4